MNAIPDRVFLYDECLDPQELPNGVEFEKIEMREILQFVADEDRYTSKLLIEHYLEGKTLLSIANQVGLSFRTLRNRIDKARRLLRHRLGTVPLSLRLENINAGKMLNRLRKSGALSGPRVTELPSVIKARTKARKKEERQHRREQEREKWKNIQLRQDACVAMPWPTYYANTAFTGPDPAVSRFAYTLSRPRAIFERVAAGLVRAGYRKTDVGNYIKGDRRIQTCNSSDPTKFFICRLKNPPS